MGRFVYGTVRSSLPKGLTPNANSIRGMGGGGGHGGDNMPPKGAAEERERESRCEGECCNSEPNNQFVTLRT